MAVEVSDAVVELEGRVRMLESVLGDPVELLRRALSILSSTSAV